MSSGAGASSHLVDTAYDVNKPFETLQTPAHLGLRQGRSVAATQLPSTGLHHFKPCPATRTRDLIAFTDTISLRSSIQERAQVIQHRDLLPGVREMSDA
jgi:hypothetical protein